MASEGGRIRIVVAHDHPIFRDGICKLLSLEDDFEIVAQTSSGQDALDVLDALHPDILLLHLHHLTRGSTEALFTLAKLRDHRDCKTKVILETGADNPGTDYDRVLEQGAKCIVVNQTAPETLATAIRKVYLDEPWLDDIITVRPHGFIVGIPHPAIENVRGYPELALNQLQRELISLIAQGLRDEQIAEKMLISEQTVGNHVRALCEKTGLSGRLELALWILAVHPSAGRERREKQRFPVEGQVHYEVLDGHCVIEAGWGKSGNVSSSGAWFTTEKGLGAGQAVEVSIVCSVPLKDSVSTILAFQGSVVRSDAVGAAIRIERYNLRSALGPNLNTWISPLPDPDSGAAGLSARQTQPNTSFPPVHSLPPSAAVRPTQNIEGKRVVSSITVLVMLGAAGLLFWMLGESLPSGSVTVQLGLWGAAGTALVLLLRVRRDRHR